MHDYHAVAALIDRLTGGAGTVDGERISEVRIRTTAVHSVEALQQAFAMLTPGTMLEGSELVVEERPDERECGACGKSWVLTSEDLAGHLLLCPSCGVPSSGAVGAGIDVVGITWSRA